LPVKQPAFGGVTAYRPCNVIFLPTLEGNGLLKVDCSFHPDRNPDAGFPCKSNGAQITWRISNEKACWAIRLPPVL